MNEVRPFSNNTEFDCWTSASCEKCKKYYILNSNGWPTCQIENALAEGTISGTVTEEIAIRMGMTQDDEEWIHYKKCTELVPLIRWHIIGELDDKKSPMFGPFNSIDEAEVKLKVASLIMKQVAPYTKLDLGSIQLSIKQTDSNDLGQIDAFVEKLSRWQVLAAFEWCAANNPAHLQSIEHRSSGSQWVHKGSNIMPWRHLTYLAWKKLHKHEYNPNIHSSDCDYYYINKSLGVQKFKLLSEFEDYSSIQLVEGKHGAELVSKEVIAVPTNIAWLIVGTAQDASGTKYTDQKMVWTAYPGELTTSIKKIPSFNGTLESCVEASRNGYPIPVNGIKAEL